MSGNGQRGHERPEKILFRIGEVSRLTDTKPFVLRYWETEFPMLHPAKSPKGHRLYRRGDIETVLLIKRLLYDEGFTIAGARRHLRDLNSAGPSRSAAASEASGSPISPGLLAKAGGPGSGFADALNRKTLLDLRDSLRAFLTLLERR